MTGIASPTAKLRKVLFSAGLVGVLLATSACSSDPAEDPKPAASTEVSQPAESALTETAPAEDESSEYGPTIDGMPTLRELASDKNGQWRKTTILPDDPAFTFDPAVIQDTVTPDWTEEDIKAAQRIAVEMAVDGIDTPANSALGDTASMEKWWDTNKGKFHPMYWEELKKDATSTALDKTIVFKVAHRKDGMPYGENAIHVSDRTLKTTEIIGGEINGMSAIAVTVQVGFSNILDVEGSEAREFTNGVVRYTFTKDNGGYPIIGYYSLYETNALQG